MPRLSPLPEQFHQTVFSRREALAAGLTDRVLAGPRCVSVAPGWYRYATTESSFELEARAGLAWLGDGAGLSHTSNLAWRGLDLRSASPVHLATRRRIDRTADGYRVHRFQGSLFLEEVDESAWSALLAPSSTVGRCCPGRSWSSSATG